MLVLVHIKKSAIPLSDHNSNHLLFHRVRNLSEMRQKRSLHSKGFGTGGDAGIILINTIHLYRKDKAILIEIYYTLSSSLFN